MNSPTPAEPGRRSGLIFALAWLLYWQLKRRRFTPTIQLRRFLSVLLLFITAATTTTTVLKNLQGFLTKCGKFAARPVSDTHRLSPLCVCVCHDGVNLTHNRSGATDAFFPSSLFYVSSAKYDNKNNSIQTKVRSPEVKRGSGHVKIFLIVGCMSMMPNSCSALFKMFSCTETW